MRSLLVIPVLIYLLRIHGGVDPIMPQHLGWTLLPLVAAILYAIAMILTRSKCHAEKSTVLSLRMNFSFIGIGAGLQSSRYSR